MRFGITAASPKAPTSVGTAISTCCTTVTSSPGGSTSLLSVRVKVVAGLLLGSGWKLFCAEQRTVAPRRARRVRRDRFMIRKAGLEWLHPVSRRAAQKPTRKRLFRTLHLRKDASLTEKAAS